MGTYFLDQACEWWTITDALRAAGTPASDPALTVWREAAWCHLLFTSGRGAAAVNRLRVVFRDVTGMSLGAATTPINETQVRAAAEDVFTQLWVFVSARHPDVFGRPAAA